MTPLPLTRESIEALGLTVSQVLYREQIDIFVEADRRQPPPAGGALFVGDSDIRGWLSYGGFAKDLGYLPAVNRGFGGARTWEGLLYFAETILPSRPRAVVYCYGDNDIWQLAAPGAENAALGFDLFLRLVREHAPFVERVFFMAIHPSPCDEPRWELIHNANARIRALCVQSGGLAVFADYLHLLLDAQDRPRPEHFKLDGLHFTAACYHKLAVFFRPLLESALKGP